VEVYIEKQANISGQSLDRPSPRHPTPSRSVAMGARGRTCVPGDERIGCEVEAGKNQGKRCEEMSGPMKRVPWAHVCVPQSCGSMCASDKELGVARSVGRARRCCDRDQLRVHTCVPCVARRSALDRISHTLDLRARVRLTLFGSSPSVGMLCTSNTSVPGRALVHSSRHCGRRAAHEHVDPPTHGVPLSPSGCAQPAGPSTSRLHSMSRVHFHAALFKRAPSCPPTQTGRPPASTDSASRFGSRREEEVRVKFGLAFERHRVRVCQEHRECQECRERRKR
jgi:hypothetical protein